MGMFSWVFGRFSEALDEMHEEHQRHKRERSAEREQGERSESSLPYGWKEKHTKRYDMLVDTDSEDGAHFSFSPYLVDLHATTNRRKTHTPIAAGLPALNLYTGLKTGGYGGLELTTKLRGYESTEAAANSLNDWIKRNQREREELWKPKLIIPKEEPVFDFMKWQREEAEREREERTRERIYIKSPATPDMSLIKTDYLHFSHKQKAETPVETCFRLARKADPTNPLLFGSSGIIPYKPLKFDYPSSTLKLVREAQLDERPGWRKLPDQQGYTNIWEEIPTLPPTNPWQLAKATELPMAEIVAQYEPWKLKPTDPTAGYHGLLPNRHREEWEFLKEQEAAVDRHVLAQHKEWESHRSTFEMDFEYENRVTAQARSNLMTYAEALALERGRTLSLPP